MAGDSTSSTIIFANEPGTNENFNMEFTENTPGTYDGNSISWMYSFIEYPVQGFMSQECGGLNCGITELIITEYGNVGEKIKGTFQGTGDFWDNQQQQVTLPYSGEFEIYRDF